MKRRFEFLITYFKPNGKFYTEAVVKWEVRSLSDAEFVPYFHDAVNKLRGLRDTGGQGSLPGLAGEWEGPIVIEYRPTGSRHLLLGRPSTVVADFAARSGIDAAEVIRHWGK